jgi:hypothetical protein
MNLAPHHRDPHVLIVDGEAPGNPVWKATFAVAFVLAAASCALVIVKDRLEPNAPGSGRVARQSPDTAGRACTVGGYYVRPDGALVASDGTVIIDAEGRGNVQAIHGALMGIGITLRWHTDSIATPEPYGVVGEVR